MKIWFFSKRKNPGISSVSLYNKMVYPVDSAIHNWSLVTLKLTKQSTFRDATTGFPRKWLLKNESRNSMLMMHHYLDLGSASDRSCHVGNLLQPMKSATSILVVTPHQYGNSAVVSQKSFPGETTSAIAKCRPISNLGHFIENVS